MKRAFIMMMCGALIALVFVGFAEPSRMAHAKAAIAGLLKTHMRSVNVSRGDDGDFSLTVKINGIRAPMVLDTGATSVVLTYETAKAIGLPIALLTYDVDIETANGRTRAAAVTLDRLAVGRLAERGVSALIAPRGALKNSLLGMSFLNRLESWEVRGDQLSLHGYP